MIAPKFAYSLARATTTKMKTLRKQYKKSSITAINKNLQLLDQ
jgi:hypothetical protein